MDINARNVRENRQILQFSGYSYQDLKNDLHIYSRIFEKIVQITTLARTIDGREIFQARIGKPDARHKILIFAGIHGREYMTCQLLMDLTASFARAILEKQTYRGYSYQTFLISVRIFLLPMVNPMGLLQPNGARCSKQRGKPKEGMGNCTQRRGKDAMETVL